MEGAGGRSSTVPPAVTNSLIRLVLEGDRVVGEERLLTDRNQRIRDVRQGKDGFIYLLTTDGQMLRLVPK